MTTNDIRAQLEEERRLIAEATDGPWEIQQGTPTMAGNTWTLRVQGKPGIRIGAHEYQHGAGNSDFIAHARTALPVRNAQVEAVLGEHVAQDLHGTWYCTTCVDELLDYQPYPCETVKAIQGASHVG